MGVLYWIASLNLCLMTPAWPYYSLGKYVDMDPTTALHYPCNKLALAAFN